MTIDLAAEQDLDGWMSLVERVKDAFPGLETGEALDEHRNAVSGFMSREAAICAKEQGRIVGTLLFSRESSMLCFLAVDPEHRRQHIAQRMVSHMLTKMDPQRDVWVTTYRDGVPQGTAARAFYKRIGFTEGRLTEAFGSPVQEFVLKR
ncbi:MAG: GNAT family N-acetyltransferase [Candidatus Ventricola sp.]